jgi:hypothetical protein
MQVTFTSAVFTTAPVLSLNTSVAGAAAVATVRLTLVNPLPTGGYISVLLPSEFHGVADVAATVAVGTAGSAQAASAALVSSSPGWEVRVGPLAAAAAAGALEVVTVQLSGVTNQQSAGDSAAVQAWTTLGTGSKIDSGSGNAVSYCTLPLLRCCACLACVPARHVLGSTMEQSASD